MLLLRQTIISNCIIPPSGMHRDVRMLHAGDYISFDCVREHMQHFLVDVGELCASKAWVDVVIYMLSATGLNFALVQKVLIQKLQLLASA